MRIATKWIATSASSTPPPVLGNLMQHLRSSASTTLIILGVIAAALGAAAITPRMISAAEARNEMLCMRLPRMCGVDDAEVSDAWRSASRPVAGAACSATSANDRRPKRTRSTAPRWQKCRDVGVGQPVHGVSPARRSRPSGSLREPSRSRRWLVGEIGQRADPAVQVGVAQVDVVDVGMRLFEGDGDLARVAPAQGHLAHHHVAGRRGQGDHQPVERGRMMIWQPSREVRVRPKARSSMSSSSSLASSSLPYHC